jgi:hypothetical protein
LRAHVARHAYDGSADCLLSWKHTCILQSLQIGALGV